MARGSIRRYRNTRFGLKLGIDKSGRQEAYLGWAVLQLARPEPLDQIKRGDPLDLARAALRRSPESPIYAYLNDEAYRGTRGDLDGLTREEHLVLVNRIAARLADEGHHVVILEIA